MRDPKTAPRPLDRFTVNGRTRVVIAVHFDDKHLQFVSYRSKKGAAGIYGALRCVDGARWRLWYSRSHPTVDHLEWP